MEREFTVKEIENKISEIRKQNNGNKQIYTNYLPLVRADNQECFTGCEGKSTILYFTKTNIVNRIVFYSSDRDELIDMLKKCPKGMGLDIASREREVEDDYIIEAGFHKIALLQRLYYPDVTMEDEELWKNKKFSELYSNRNDEIVEYAKKGDEKELLTLFKQIFNIYIDHVPTEKELLENYIEKDGMLVCRENGKIVALIGYLLNGKRMFLIHAVNISGDYRKLAALSVRLRDIALEKKVKFCYGMLELSENREKALKYYQRRGTELVDFFNHIYANADIRSDVGEIVG
ncbi:MAG: hypothetical protein ACLSAO_03055 [Anaerovoracaceae bacterium]